MTLQFTLLVRNYSLGWSELRLINKVFQVLEGTEETRRMSTDPARWPVNTCYFPSPTESWASSSQKYSKFDFHCDSEGSEATSSKLLNTW